MNVRLITTTAAMSAILAACGGGALDETPDERAQDLAVSTVQGIRVCVVDASTKCSTSAWSYRFTGRYYAGSGRPAVVVLYTRTSADCQRAVTNAQRAIRVSGSTILRVEASCSKR